MTFSIIIPVYNEERRIPHTIDTILSFFFQRPSVDEIIFVDDGSTDRTRDILSEYEHRGDIRVISYKKNKGKGYAVRTGALEAKGEWVIFFDIDLATPLDEFDSLRKYMKDEDMIIIGSRRLEGSDIKKYESSLRTFLGQGFTRLSNILVPRVKDFTCGFKCFSRDAVRNIFPVARIDRWGFDTELLYIAKLKGIPIRQMPVRWAHDDDSRVRVLKAVWDSFWELVRMKINQIRGFYK